MYYKMIWDFLRNKVFGPQLFKEYGTQRLYESNKLEIWGDQILSTLKLCWNIGMYTSPIIMVFMYRRNYFAIENINMFAKIGTGIATVVALSFLIRGIGRAYNETYSKFINTLVQVQNNVSNEDAVREMKRFDFEFPYFPIDFISQVCEVDKKETPNESRNSSISAPCRILGYLAIHTFGLKMIYPGSVKLIQYYLQPMLLQGRSKLIEEEQATRYKVKTCDGNEIDTIFVDNRGKHSNGRTLVICSEGNAGFYEIGIMSTPVTLKYSVLGWNHPGFGGSTGEPYPSQDKTAVEGVMQFALNKLGFDVKDIILNGWSIGAFSTLNLAIKHDVRGIILDATFDDILPLALPRMPQAFGTIVRIAIRENINLHHSELMKQYSGPVMLIRRTEDEIITTEEGSLLSNRGNYLLISLLKYRFPKLLETDIQQTYIKVILARPLDRTILDEASELLCNGLLESYFRSRDKSYPVYIGESLEDEDKNKLILYLVKKHLIDYKSTHCTPLPTDSFKPDLLFDIAKFN